MKYKFEESIITTIIILINILVFGIPDGNSPIKSICGFVVLWIVCYLIMTFEIKVGESNEPEHQ